MKLSKQDLDDIFSGVRNDYPARKASRMAQPKDMEIQQNYPGCTGIRNPPEEHAKRSVSAQMIARAVKYENEIKRRNKRLKSGLRKR